MAVLRGANGQLYARQGKLVTCVDPSGCENYVTYSIEIPGTNLSVSDSFNVLDEWGYTYDDDPADPTYSTYVVVSIQIVFDNSDPCNQHWYLIMYLCYQVGPDDEPGGTTEIWEAAIDIDGCGCPVLGTVDIATESGATVTVSIT